MIEDTNATPVEATTTNPVETKPAAKLVKAKSNGASKPTVKATTKKVVAKKEPASNEVTLADICRDMKIEPKVARVKLRASKLKKPASGSWSWPKGSAVIKDVRKTISE